MDKRQSREEAEDTMQSAIDVSPGGILVDMELLVSDHLPDSSIMMNKSCCRHLA
jgi:hypothetical protein